MHNYARLCGVVPSGDIIIIIKSIIMVIIIMVVVTGCSGVMIDDAA